MVNKSINKKLSLFLVILFLLIFLANFVLAGEQAKLNRFKDSETKLILTNVNRYNLIIERYADEFGVPKTLLQALIGVGKTAGILDPYDVYSAGGAIGLMNLVPFYSDGTNIHYFDCLESGCMNDEVEYLDREHLTENRKKVKYEYTNPHNSICCATYILEKKSHTSIIYPGEESKCKDSRTQVTYDGWEAAVRKFNPFFCGDDNDIYFVERVMQLNSSFTKFTKGNIINYGLLKFVPSFKIKAPRFPKIYENLSDIISNLQETESEAGVSLKLTNIGSKYNVTFRKFCEEPEVNIFNSIYDNFVNAVEFDYPECKYLVADKIPFSGHMEMQTLLFVHDSTANKLSIKNNLSLDLFRNYELTVPENFFLGFDNLTIVQVKPSYSMEYQINNFNRPDSSPLIGIENIFFVNDYASDVSELVFYKNVSNVGVYYNTFGQEINLTISPLLDCDSSLDNYRLKYFTCLDTGEREEVYDWVSGKWEESAETIKIKLAFALKRK
jgi:hypothetical protein